MADDARDTVYERRRWDAPTRVIVLQPMQTCKTAVSSARAEMRTKVDRSVKRGDSCHFKEGLSSQENFTDTTCACEAAKQGGVAVAPR